MKVSKGRFIYFRHQVSRYVLFLVGRVGSTYLRYLLNSHPNILVLGEELAELKEKGAEAQLEWAQRFLTPPLVGRNGAIGFHAKLVQILAPEGFAQLLRQKQCQIIHMQRRNRIKVVVSHINGRRLAEATGMWGLFNEADRLPPFAIDPEEFDNLLKQREKRDQDLDNYVSCLQLPTLSLYYEDLLQDRDAVLQQVFSFLEINPRLVHQNMLKNTSDNLRDVIINFDELRANYVGTQYEPMFDEVLVESSSRPD